MSSTPTLSVASVEPPSTTDGLRLMVYDRTCTGRWYRPGLSHAWWSGARLYRLLGRFDAWIGVQSWDEALAWLGEIHPGRPIAQVQYWGHGKWGAARAGRQILDDEALRPRAPAHAAWVRVADRMLPGSDGLWWFRTCETLGALRGQAFAAHLAETLGCRVAGHTYIIGPIQSGLHVLAPGEPPRWSPSEGLAAGTPEAPARALWSRWNEPNTITCLQSAIPSDFE